MCSMNFWYNEAIAQDEKSDLHSHLHPVPKCKCRECNTFAYSANSCANVIKHLKRINALFENHFCEAMIERQNHMKCSEISTH